MPCANGYLSRTHNSGFGSTSAGVESPQPHDAAGGALLTKVPGMVRAARTAISS
jgi:hypothetical protein